MLAVAFRERALCTRSGTCIGVCPEGALSLGDDYYPILNSKLCTECGKCGTVCPGGSVNFQKLSKQASGLPDDGSFDGQVQNTYIGHAADSGLHENGTGGGVITALAADLLANGEISGCVVTRMRSDKPWLGEPFIARSLEELTSSQGSRYTVIPLNQTLREIRETPGRYAVIGLPCHIHGIREAMQLEPMLRERIVALLGTFCGGALEPVVVPELLRTKSIPLDAISDFQFRGGEWPGQMRAVFPDRPPQPVHFSNYKDGAYNYLIGIYLPKRCQVCFDGSNLFADISVGDAWTRSEDGQYKYRSQSRLLVRSARGQDLVQRAVENGTVVLEDVSADPSYRTHKIRTKRKSMNAPLRHARWKAKGIAVPEYDRREPDATTRERLIERFVSMFLWIGDHPRLRYPLVKLLTSQAMVPLIKLRLWRKRRKYQRRALHRG